MSIGILLPVARFCFHMKFKFWKPYFPVHSDFSHEAGSSMNGYDFGYCLANLEGWPNSGEYYFQLIKNNNVCVKATKESGRLKSNKVCKVQSPCCN